MAKVFLIDGANANRVLGEYDSKKDARGHIREKWKRGEGEGYTITEYLNRFSFVGKSEMDEAVRLYGSRKKKYWT